MHASFHNEPRCRHWEGKLHPSSDAEIPNVVNIGLTIELSNYDYSLLMKNMHDQGACDEDFNGAGEMMAYCTALLLVGYIKWLKELAQKQRYVRLDEE